MPLSAPRQRRSAAVIAAVGAAAHTHVATRPGIPACDQPPAPPPATSAPMSESELAESAYSAAEALGFEHDDLSDPASFGHAEAAVRAASSGHAEAEYDVHAVGCFLVALKAAAAARGVQPSALWSALDALERT